VRAYGIVCLRKSVLARTPASLANAERIFSLLTTQLKDEDSFVYGNAVRGLSALGDILPERVLPLLTQQYASVSVTEASRLKIGEALLQVSQRAGEVLPKYGGQFMDLFLRATRDSSPLMRASALSNLAQLCKQMRFALHPYISEVLECVGALLATDRDEGVRRGAVYVLVLLFRGLGPMCYSLSLSTCVDCIAS